MAIVASLFALAGRFVGKVLTTTLGWASTLLFGRVAPSKQLLLALVTFGSIAWVVMLAGVVLPDVGSMLLAAVPVPEFIDESWVRLAMLVAAIVTPLLMGIGNLVLLEGDRRPRGPIGIGRQLLRGYPLALLLALTLVFLAVVAVVRRVRTLARRWSDAHIPVVVKPGGYERMVRDLEDALDAAGLDTTSRPASRILSTPPTLVARVAGPGVQALVPDRLTNVVGRDLEILLYPSDIAIAGSSAVMARARAAIASRLSSTSAYLTSTPDAQAIEDRLERLLRDRRADGSVSGALEPATVRELPGIDDALAHLDVPYEEWEVLYRIRLQAERDLLAGDEAGATFPGRARPAPRPGPEPAPAWAPLLAGGGLALVLVDVVLALVERVRPTRSP